MYLDVDDTLISFPPLGGDEARAFYLANPKGAPANEVENFLKFSISNFDVRWLTMWCPSGDMHPERMRELADILKVDRGLVWFIRNPMSFWWPKGDDLKTNGINWDEHAAGKPWVWVEDEILYKERELLRGRKCLDNYIPCNVSLNANRLVEVMEILKERFAL